ncbi:MAG: TonB-dependent receptor, partial [Limnochordia bacterium]
MPKKIMSFFCLLFLLVSPVLAQGETYTIVVTASRIPQGILDAPVAVSIVTAEEIEASGVQTVEDALRLVSGLTIRSQGPVGSQASVSLRGSTSAQVLVLVDGRPINCPRSGGVDLSNIPTGNVERIEVLKGPASALYGADALAGVINIITKGASGRGGYLHTSLGSNGYRFYRGQIQDGSDTLDLFLHADWTGSASFPQSSFGDYEQIAFGGRLDYQISPFSS